MHDALKATKKKKKKHDLKLDQNDPDYEFFRGQAALPDCALLPVTRAASQFSLARSN